MSDETDQANLVSIVIPMLNELGCIDRCLAGFRSQTVGPERLDVIVVDGGSTDGSRQWVADFARTNHWCRLTDNPKGKASAAFNLGMERARGKWFALFSAHGEPAVDFVERSLAVLDETGAAGVGGQCPHQGAGPMEQAIGLAMQSPFGMASPTRNVTQRRDVDTIIHPMYVTEWARSIGSFDETLERNSDYEFNYRMRQAGFRLVADPTIKSVYHPRSDLRGLARQFWAYGRWKARVIRNHPGSMKPRHVVPAVFVAAVLGAPVWARGPAGRKAFALGVVAYGASSAVAAMAVQPLSRGTTACRVAVCFPVMHITWGAGLLASFVGDVLPRPRR